MTNLSFPIWVMRSDAETIRAGIEKITDPQIKQMCIDRADQCERAAQILELYEQHIHGQPQDRNTEGRSRPDC